MIHNSQRASVNAPVCLKQCPHRRADICNLDGVQLHLHADAGYCPENRLPVVGEKPDGWEELKGNPSLAVEPSREVTPAVWGPPLWRELEAWAASADLSTVPAYLEAFALRVPCGGCREHWRGIVAAHPPDVSDLVRWAVDRHNDVNLLLGKPVFAR